VFYENAEVSDGARFLVERLWPRGMKKEKLNMEVCLKDIAPSDGLRRWFEHDPLTGDKYTHIDQLSLRTGQAKTRVR
jgi:uncharacterized protein YeaO (DUF488 family)